MSYQFERWLITLGGQVYALQQSISTKQVQMLEKDAANYEAELQSLYSYAEHHHIPLLPYHSALIKLEGRLYLVYEHLREQQESPDF